jgi:hypothetical protein
MICKILKSSHLQYTDPVQGLTTDGYRRRKYCTSTFGDCRRFVGRPSKIPRNLKAHQKAMKHAQLLEDKYLQISWDEQTRIISIDWKEATSMTDEDFKTELTLFAKQVEDKRAPRILIDVSKFRHRPSAEVGEWRLKNISTRYSAAGVRRFAFLLSKDS